ncbi:MAG: hypothetical protein M1582_04600 [Actinobacteria bacterium]|nr:hypothetical protein [Actinomycetota bacterium]
MSLDPNDINTMTDTEAESALAKLMGRGGKQPPTPQAEWVPLYDQRTGALIGMQDPKTSQIIRYSAQPSGPSVTERRYDESKFYRNRYGAPPGSTVPTHYTDDMGNRITLDKNEQIAARPAFIQQRLSEIDAELANANDQSPRALQTLYRERDQLGGDLAVAQAAASRGVFGLGGAGGGGSTRVRFPDEVALSGAQADYYKAQTDKLRREQEPKLGLMAQQYIESVKTLRGMMERGEIDPNQADGYLTLFKQNMESALRGTDPFNEQKLQLQESRQRADIGKELVNSRLTSSTSVANSLLSGFFNNLPTLGMGLKEGQTVPFDPFAIAGAFSTQAQGGQEISDLAKTLLGGINPGGQTPQAAPPTQTPANTSTGHLNVDLLYDLGRQMDAKRMQREAGQANGQPSDVNPAVAAGQ